MAGNERGNSAAGDSVHLCPQMSARRQHQVRAPGHPLWKALQRQLHLTSRSGNDTSHRQMTTSNTALSTICILIPLPYPHITSRCGITSERALRGGLVQKLSQTQLRPGTNTVSAHCQISSLSKDTASWPSSTRLHLDNRTSEHKLDWVRFCDYLREPSIQLWSIFEPAVQLQEYCRHSP